MIHLLPNDKAKCAGNLSVYTQPMLQQNSSLQNRRTQTPPPTMASLHSQCHLMETKKSGKTQLTPSCISQKKKSPLALDFQAVSGCVCVWVCVCVCMCEYVYDICARVSVCVWACVWVWMCEDVFIRCLLVSVCVCGEGGRWAYSCATCVLVSVCVCVCVFVCVCVCVCVCVYMCVCVC